MVPFVVCSFYHNLNFYLKRGRRQLIDLTEREQRWKWLTRAQWESFLGGWRVAVAGGRWRARRAPSARLCSGSLANGLPCAVEPGASGSYRPPRPGPGGAGEAPGSVRKVLGWAGLPRAQVEVAGRRVFCSFPELRCLHQTLLRLQSAPSPHVLCKLSDKHRSREDRDTRHPA